ncbi:hypothetical protein [Rhodopseudomonas palustris]|uniref:Uncharacterized protein n=1 Tax=Rhodopseudomonas palustris (strain BisB18) TaxID=316056 RepID=Q212P0_RHOPB
MRPLIHPATLLLLAATLGGCAGVSNMTFTDDAGTGNQPFPTNYRSELLAFFRTYLTDPVGVRDAMMADPLQRSIGGRQRYVSCLRFNARKSDGSYIGIRDRVVVYVDARLDRIMEEPGDTCAGVNYQPFPELEKLTR